MLCLSRPATGQRAASGTHRDFPERWVAGNEVDAAAVRACGLEAFFTESALPDAVFARMRGVSFVDNPHVARTDLRYLRLLHYDEAGRIRMGELVCNRRIARDLLEIFRALYAERYPIAKVKLIDDYGADDEKSMGDNNTSCFCYRQVQGTAKLSRHALGMAVDINPLYNPYCRRRKDGTLAVRPSAARPYADRRKSFRQKITREDLCYKLFTARGFKWGGAWKSCQDYQHFEK
ncbi:MAG: M15 family metallopeptidase [Alloprevotella sp.]|nr:M15 family metallopeptidase [Alloprevotella sp.]